MRIVAVVVALLVVAAGLVGPGRELTAFGLWWLTNSQPPQVTVRGPGTAVRGAFDVAVELQPTGQADVVGAELDGRFLPTEAGLRVDTTTLPDGEHTLTVRAQDRSLRRNAASATLRFSSDNTPPTFQVETRPPGVPQGRTAVIHILPSEPAEIQASLGGARLAVHAAGSEYWTVLGVHPDEQPGPRELVVEGRDRVGNAGRVTSSVSIESHEFTRDSLQVSAALLPLLQPDVRAEEEQRLRTTYYSRENGPPLWKGPFLRPVVGPITTQFGEVRSYNGGPFQGHHIGTDFQVGADVAIQAPANGRVVAREEVKLRGRILILDHGGGVYSTYAHLSEWLVEQGQQVEQRQPIAKVGSTGLSTGPHLHWEIWVNGKAVDPMEWTEREVP